LVIAKTGVLAVTEVDCDSLPPAPEHCNMYETVPAAVGVTAAEPVVGSAPDQSLSLGLADAVHAVEFVLDQVRVADCPSVIAAAEADNVTVGFGGGGGVPPPHAFRRPRPQIRMGSRVVFFIAHPKACKVASNLPQLKHEPGTGRAAHANAPTERTHF
jgi:hypothetical protein